MKSDETQDPLTRRLRREATAERPAFSQQLHHRILLQIHGERSVAAEDRAIRNIPRRSVRWRWLAAGTAAAAALSAGYLLIGPRLARPHHPLPPDGSNAMVQTTPQPSREQPLDSSLASIERPLNFGGILYERLWPPGITVRLPASIIGAARSPEIAEARPAGPTARPGSPEWLLTAIEKPTQTAASAALADVMSPEERFLIRLASDR